MKRWCSLFWGLCMLALTTGCASLISREYTTVTPYVEQHTVEENEEALVAENYLSLKNAILSFVEDGMEHGVIRVYDYDGDVEADLAAATYEVSRADPLGAYAVDFLIRRIDGSADSPLKIEIKPELVERDSVKQLPAEAE